MGSITLEHVKKSFGTNDIIPDASLEIADKSFRGDGIPAR